MESLLMTSLLDPSTRMAHPWFDAKVQRLEPKPLGIIDCDVVAFIIFYFLSLIAFTLDYAKGKLELCAFKDFFFTPVVFLDNSFLYNSFLIYFFFTNFTQ